MKYLQSLVLKRLALSKRSGDAAARFGGPCLSSSNERANWHRPAAAKGHSANEYLHGLVLYSEHVAAAGGRSSSCEWAKKHRAPCGQPPPPRYTHNLVL